MKPPLFAASLATLLLIAPAFAQAQPPQGPPDGPQPPRQMERQMRRERPEGRQAPRTRPDLGLTDIQKADLRKARESARRERLRKSTDMKIASMDLKSLLRADKVDEKAVAAKLAEVQAAQGALLKLKVDSALAMKRILTPEQQKMLMQNRGRRPGMNQRNRGMRSPGNRSNGWGRGERSMRPDGPFDDADDVDLDVDDGAAPGYGKGGR